MHMLPLECVMQWVKTHKRNIEEKTVQEKKQPEKHCSGAEEGSSELSPFLKSFVRNSSKPSPWSAYFETWQIMIIIFCSFQNLVNECLFWRSSFLARSNKAANIKCIFGRFKALFKTNELPILSVCNKSANCWLIACCHHVLSLDGFIFLSLSFSMDIITYKLVPPSCCSGRYHGEYLGPAWKLLNEHKLINFGKTAKSRFFHIHSTFLKEYPAIKNFDGTPKLAISKASKNFAIKIPNIIFITKNKMNIFKLWHVRDGQSIWNKQKKTTNRQQQQINSCVSWQY